MLSVLAGMVGVAVGIGSAGLSASPSTHLIVDSALKRTPAELTEISAERIRFNDAAGLSKTMSIGEVLAVLPGRPDDLGEPVAVEAAGRGLAVRIVLELTDGQRFVGKAATPAGSEAVAWDTKLFGKIEAPFERVRRVVLHPETSRPGEMKPAARDDELTLLNGDRVTGLVESFGPVVGVEAGGQRLSIGAERIATITFANPDAEPPKMMVRLEDSTIVGVTGVRTISPTQIELTVPSMAAGTKEGQTAAVKVLLSDVEAVWFDAGRLRALANLPVDRYEASPGRRWTRAPIVYGAGVGQAGDIEIPGPMTVEWAAPAAMRFAGSIVLPRRSLEWGDAEVMLEVGGSGAGSSWTPLLKENLNADHPVVEFNVELPGQAARLRLRLEPGTDGTVQDRVILRDAVLLMPGK